MDDRRALIPEAIEWMECIGGPMDGTLFRVPPPRFLARVGYLHRDKTYSPYAGVVARYELDMRFITRRGRYTFLGYGVRT